MERGHWGIRIAKQALALLALLAFAPLSASAASVAFFVNLVLQGHSSDITTGDGEMFARMVGKQVARKYPRSTFIAIEARTPEELRMELSGHMDSSTQVDALVVMSHGASNLSWIRPPRKEPKALYFSNIVDGDSASRFSLNLVEEEDVKRGFAPVIGRFSPGASIVFMACSLLEAGDLDAKRLALESVARNFGLESGSLYMNEKPGHYLAKIMTQPAWVQDFGRNGWEHLKAQLTFVVTYPAALIADRLYFNHGYRLSLRHDSRGNRESTIWRDQVFSAMASFRPEGEQVYRRVDQLASPGLLANR